MPACNAQIWWISVISTRAPAPRRVKAPLHHDFLFAHQGSLASDHHICGMHPRRTCRSSDLQPRRSCCTMHFALKPAVPVVRMCRPSVQSPRIRIPVVISIAHPPLLSQRGGNSLPAKFLAICDVAYDEPHSALCESSRDAISILDCHRCLRCLRPIIRKDAVHGTRRSRDGCNNLRGTDVGQHAEIRFLYCDVREADEQLIDAEEEGKRGSFPIGPASSIQLLLNHQLARVLD